MDWKFTILSETLPPGGGSLCDSSREDGGIPKVGGGLPKVGGGLAFSLARGKRKYEGWIQREVDGGDAGSETESETESEATDEEDNGEFVTQDRENRLLVWW